MSRAGKSGSRAIDKELEDDSRVNGAAQNRFVSRIA